MKQVGWEGRCTKLILFSNMTSFLSIVLIFTCWLYTRVSLVVRACWPSTNSQWFIDRLRLGMGALIHGHGDPVGAGAQAHGYLWPLTWAPIPGAWAPMPMGIGTELAGVPMPMGMGMAKHEHSNRECKDPFDQKPGKKARTSSVDED
jgi:hypothetical protein